MRRHALASFAGSTSGTGNGRALFGRASATRGASGEADGSGAPAHRRSVLAAAFLALALLVALTATPAQASSRAVRGKFCTVVGEAGGQCRSSTGVAVNLKGAGGVTADDIYISDKENNRVQEFSAEGAFVRAWGVNVVRTGPDNSTAVNEVQTVTVKAGGGTFTLTLNFNGSTQTTAPIAYNAPAKESEGAGSVEAALKAPLSNVGAIGGTIAVTGGPGSPTGSTPYTLTFGGALAGTDVTQVTVTENTLAIAEGTTLTCTGGPSASHTLAYQWLSSGAPATGPGATTTTYTTVAADAGKVVQCQVVATPTTGTAKTGGTAISNPRIVAAPFPATSPPLAPNSIAVPTVVGGGNLTAAGKVLKCAEGTWTGASSFSFQWYRNGVALSGNGASTSEYTVQAADVATAPSSTAANFQCAVTGTNAGGSVTRVSGNRITASPLQAPNPTAPTTTSVVTGASSASASTTTNGVAAFEICVAANGDVCQRGTGSATAGAVSNPQSIAIDQANGNVYVASFGNNRIDVFSAKGNFEGAFGWKVNAASPEENLQFCTSSCQAGGGSGSVGAGLAGFVRLEGAALAVTPGGSPNAGDVLVSDKENLRINEFTPALNGSKEVTGVSFARAFGGDVISGGATGTSGQTGNFGLGPVVTAVLTSTKAFQVGQTITGEGIAPGTTIISRQLSDNGNNGPPFSLALGLSRELAEAKASVSNLVAGASASNVSRNEKQSIAVGATGGTFALKFGSAPTAGGKKETTTVAIPYNASALEVETALKNLENIGSGNVEVTGSPGSYVVEFTGTRYTDTNVSQLVPETGLLTGGSAVVTTTVEGTSPEICTTATSCQAGSPGAAGGFFPAGTPTGLAVDSSGFVYAVSAAGTCSATSPCRVQKFNPDGSFKEAFGPSSGGAADCQLTWETGSANAEAPVGVAVDPSNQHVFVTRKSDVTHFEVCEFESTPGGAVLKDRSPASPRETNSSGYLAPSVSSTGNVYVNAPISGAQGAVYLLGPVPPPGSEIGAASEVTQTSAKLCGKITVPSLEGEGFETTYHFEYSADGINWSNVPNADVSVGDDPGTYNECQVVSGLEPNQTYRFRLVATAGPSVTSGEGHFKTLGAAPSISHTEALPVTGTTAKLNAYVNANNSPTTYHFEWGVDTSYGHEVPDFDPFIGSGGQPIAINASISGLELCTTYHFRIEATNALGTTKGPDTVFTTDCVAGLNGQGLPDNRGYEQVSPIDKRPTGEVRLFAPHQLAYQGASDGNSVFYSILNGLDGSTAGGEVRYLAKRSTAGWESSQVSAPNLVPFPARGFEETSHILYNSPNLSCGFLSSYEPLTERDAAMEEDLQHGLTNLYRRNSDGSYTLISAPVPLNATELDSVAGDDFTIDGASSDCSHVLFHTQYRLLAGAPSEGLQGTYEWENGTLRLALVLPDGSLAAGATMIGAISDGVAGNGLTHKYSTFNSMSEDGSRIFFTAPSNEGEDSGKSAVFVRKNAIQTVDVSQSQSATPNNSATKYQIATPDGKHVYFTARYGLALNGASTGATACTNNGKATFGQGCDLYDYEVENPVTHLPKLTDLSVDTNPADVKGASVLGLVDVSDDGSYAYFIARGQLVPPQGKTEAQNLAASTSNLYLNHNGSLSFVGVVGSREAEFSGGGSLVGSNLAQEFSSWAADATPNGKHLLFVSTANVTGYDSDGVTEVYRYSARSDSTVCVSCRTDGEPSVGNVRTVVPITNMTMLRALTLGSQGKYRPRSISDDGSRIFFMMPDVLAPGGVSGAKNLYEWEKGKVYLLAAGEGSLDATNHAFNARLRPVFIDSSSSGDDVFFTSQRKLVGQDFDNTTDLYDARVNGGFAPPPPAPTPCDPIAGQCQGQASQPPPSGNAPASESFSGPGNPVNGTGGKGKVKKHHKKRHIKKNRKHGKRAANVDRRTTR